MIFVITEWRFYSFTKKQCLSISWTWRNALSSPLDGNKCDDGAHKENKKNEEPKEGEELLKGEHGDSQNEWDTKKVKTGKVKVVQGEDEKGDDDEANA